MNVFVTKCHNQHISEQFNPLKLHQSVSAACLSVRAFEGEAHMTAQKVCEKVLEWLENKTEVTSRDIRRVAGSVLATYHPEAAYIYQQYESVV